MNLPLRVDFNFNKECIKKAEKWMFLVTNTRHKYKGNWNGRFLGSFMEFLGALFLKIPSYCQ
jgi:hypothetical protein